MIKQLFKWDCYFYGQSDWLKRLIETKVLRIGYGKNKDIGLVQIRQRNTHKQLQIGEIGYEKNNDIGLVQIKDNQTPTNNPQANERHFTNERTNEKIKRADVANIKHSTRTQRKNKRGNTA